ncbi:MAG: helix-turn-helix domain-containing protein [Clostridia bacterium]|nr:helix-turn-helix domain-containing protein [Clostridia bacterium]
MELKDKLKELRLSHHMTQESVADYLGVTSQTVSKWERGLLSPDIALLPKIAGLYRCSIDSLFSMDAVWCVEHQEEFMKTISAYKRRNDWAGEYDAWMREIEMNPDHYENYVKVMLAVVLRKDFSDDKVKKMLSLAERVEKCCTDDTLRNEMYRVMVAVCAESQDEETKKKAEYYYNKLPYFIHSREMYARYVMEGETYHRQVKETLTGMVSQAEVSVRQLITPDMPPHQKLFYYQKAAGLYEILLDGRYGGILEGSLVWDYMHCASLLRELEQSTEADFYMEKIFAVWDGHLNARESIQISDLLFLSGYPKIKHPGVCFVQQMKTMLEDAHLAPYHEKIQDYLTRYAECFKIKI